MKAQQALAHKHTFMCMCVCVCVCVCVFVYDTQTCVHALMGETGATSAGSSTHIYVHMYVYDTQTYVRAHTQAKKAQQALALVNHGSSHTKMHIYPHKHVHEHEHTHRRRRRSRRWLWSIMVSFLAHQNAHTPTQ